MFKMFLKCIADMGVPFLIHHFIGKLLNLKYFLLREFRLEQLVGQCIVVYFHPLVSVL